MTYLTSRLKTFNPCSLEIENETCTTQTRLDLYNYLKIWLLWYHKRTALCSNIQSLSCSFFLDVLVSKNSISNYSYLTAHNKRFWWDTVYPVVPFVGLGLNTGNNKLDTSIQPRNSNLVSFSLNILWIIFVMFIMHSN